MPTRRIQVVLPLLIVLLALFAAGAGVFWRSDGAPIPFTTERGTVVELQGSGLYRYDSVATAAQAIAQDVVTLVIGIPLLLIATYLYARGSLRGHVLLAGTLGYFLYTYTSLAMLSAYNELFLVYVALFSLSLFAFVPAVTTLYAAEFTARFPRRAIAYASLFLALALSLLWLGLIAPSFTPGITPAGLDNATTLVIQVLDLGIIVPTAVMVGVLLLRRHQLGYVLASVLMIKGVTMGAATSAMVVGQLLAGVAVPLPVMLLFPTFTVIFVVLAALLLRSLPSDQQPTFTTRHAH